MSSLMIYSRREGRIRFITPDCDAEFQGLAFKPNAGDNREAQHSLLNHSGAWISDDIMTRVEDSQGLVLMTEWDDIVDANFADISDLTGRPRLLFDGRKCQESPRFA